MSCPTNETLILWHDGELPSRKRSLVEPHVGSCTRCAGLVRALEAQRGLTLEALQASLEGVSFAGLAERVLAAVERERPMALRDRIRVWLEEFFDHRRRVWIPATAVLAACVIAAGAWRLVPVSVPPDPGGSAVESITATPAAIVFDIPSADGLSSTAVVWVNDEEASPGGSGT